jgi:hypothetical protein
VPAVNKVVRTEISAWNCAVLASAPKRGKRLRHLFVKSACASLCEKRLRHLFVKSACGVSL